MKSLFKVTEDQIKSLNDLTLTKLLRQLLNTEAAYNRIPLSSITISLELNTPDDGEDGRIQWQDGPDQTDWLPNRLTTFQVRIPAISDTQSC